MGYEKVLGDGTVINVPYWHGYCEKHKVMFLLRLGCDQCQEKENKEK